MKRSVCKRLHNVIRGSFYIVATEILFPATVLRCGAILAGVLGRTRPRLRTSRRDLGSHGGCAAARRAQRPVVSAGGCGAVGGTLLERSGGGDRPATCRRGACAAVMAAVDLAHPMPCALRWTAGSRCEIPAVAFPRVSTGPRRGAQPRWAARSQRGTPRSPSRPRLGMIRTSPSLLCRGDRSRPPAAGAPSPRRPRQEGCSESAGRGTFLGAGPGTAGRLTSVEGGRAWGTEGRTPFSGWSA